MKKLVPLRARARALRKPDRAYFPAGRKLSARVRSPRFSKIPPTAQNNDVISFRVKYLSVLSPIHSGRPPAAFAFYGVVHPLPDALSARKPRGTTLA